jgi:U3 small nucleolar RNA-associated protein 11
MALKDVVKKRTHKERSQPAARRKYGLLEKKKDYLLRARDFHKKESAIKTLRRKAEERNPDEFYFAMEKQKTKDGVHVAPTAHANAYSADEIRLMKTQDVGYLTMKLQMEKKKVERLKENVHGLGKNGTGSHTVFVDSEKDVESFDPSEHFETPAELLDRKFNRPRISQLADGSLVVSALKNGESIERVSRRVKALTRSAQQEIDVRKSRQRALNRTRNHLQGQRDAMSSGRKVKVSKHGAPVKQFRWKSERKR